MDDLLIPNEHLSVLPNLLLFETLMYVGEERFEWVAGVVVDEATKELLYEVWIKNENRSSQFCTRRRRKSKMPIYHKIVMNGRVLYREFDSARGHYELEMITEQELIEILMDQAVESSIEVDQEAINCAVRGIMSTIQREMVQNYITYLEMVSESLYFYY
ncbi:hypothetical protein ACQKL5_15960 [Peribacillus sp. NPDC097675]|uniref:hypothetical protein n=1 Tax=Peribacillus sp. NPDC097675 TaxID=3390618 RepID=UPI003D03A021